MKIVAIHFDIAYQFVDLFFKYTCINIFPYLKDILLTLLYICSFYFTFRWPFIVWFQWFVYLFVCSEFYVPRQFFTNMETSPLLVKGFKLWPGPKVIKLFLYSYSDSYSVLGICAPLSTTLKRGYKSFGVRSPLSWIWSTYSKIITYGVSRDFFFKNTWIWIITKSNILNRDS